MPARGILRVLAGMVAACAVVLSLSGPVQAGLFERLFGGFRHALRVPDRLPDQIRGFVEPGAAAPDRDINPSGQVEGGPTKAFCVRTCDGHFFPVVAHPGLSAADACHSFCPASQTRLYSGSTIDGAVAHDGSRYADLPNAFVYRQHLVAGCTCNGYDQFGLAHIDAGNDPTLRPGDVVATANGMVALPAARTRPRSSRRPVTIRISPRNIVASCRRWKATHAADSSSKTGLNAAR